MTSSGGAGDRFQEFLATLEKLPPFRGVTFRGCSGDAQFVRDGQSVVTRGLVSSSRSLDVATERRTAPALYAVMSRTGRDISPFSAKREEHEVVFLPGTLFFLAESRRLAGLDVRLVFELETGGGPQQLPDDLVTRFAEEMERFLSSRLAAPVAQVEPVPGKFAGDID